MCPPPGEEGEKGLLIVEGVGRVSGDSRDSPEVPSEEDAPPCWSLRGFQGLVLERAQFRLAVISGQVGLGG